jgi:hypothetical protein
MLAKQHANRMERLRKAAERRAIVRSGGKKPLIQVPGEVKVAVGQKEAEGAGRTIGLMEFAKSIQEAVFGKGGDKLVDATTENSDLTKENSDALATTNTNLGKLVDQGLKVVFR